MTIADDRSRLGHNTLSDESEGQSGMAESPMRRDWFGHALQVMAIVIPLGGGLFFWSQAITEHFGEQAASIAAAKAEHDALRRQVDRDEQSLASFQALIAQKLDTISGTVGDTAKDLSLLRKDLRR